MLVDGKEGGKGGGRQQEGLFRRQEETRMKTIQSCLADACAKATETRGGTQQTSAAASLRSAVLVSGLFIHPGPKKPFLKIHGRITTGMVEIGLLKICSSIKAARTLGKIDLFRILEINVW